LDGLTSGHKRWMEDRKSKRVFPGGPYVLLHTLSHLLIQSLSMRCGYPASSIRERIYADHAARRYGILFYTASPDEDGTLGGQVQQARSTRRGRAWRDDGFTAPPATAARSWQRHPARCGTIISTARSWFLRLAYRVQRFFRAFSD
jgi:hypothetical protein